MYSSMIWFDSVRIHILCLFLYIKRYARLTYPFNPLYIIPFQKLSLRGAS